MALIKKFKCTRLPKIPMPHAIRRRQKIEQFLVGGAEHGQAFIRVEQAAVNRPIGQLLPPVVKAGGKFINCMALFIIHKNIPNLMQIHKQGEGM